jgi:hypothetical protein
VVLEGEVKVYKYRSYDEYVSAQKSAFKRKYKNVWAIEENIAAISEYLKPLNPQRGLCHGVRQGWEVKWFRQYLPSCETIGSEIGHAIKPWVFKWDFNQVHPEWIGAFDFVYSNSFDHAYDPRQTLTLWSKQARQGGRIILEYDRRQEHTGEISKSVNPTDPVSIKVDELIGVIPQWIPGAVVEILAMPVVTQEWRKAVVIRL